MNKRTTTGTFLLAAFLLVSSNAQAVRYYVDCKAAPGGNGLSWATAYTNLQQALKGVWEAPEVWVAEGTYKPESGGVRAGYSLIYADQNAVLLGGFTNGMTSAGQRNPAAYPTVLSGDIGIAGVNTDNSYQVVRSAAPFVTVDGFTIRDGYGDHPSDQWQTYGAGLSAWGYSATFVKVANCTFLNNHARLGGAVYMRNSDPSQDSRASSVFSNCLFVGNSADPFATGGNRGGAVYNAGRKRCVFVDCAFHANSAEYYGTCIDTYAVETNALGEIQPEVLRNCTISGSLVMPKLPNGYTSHHNSPINLEEKTGLDASGSLFVGNGSGYGGVVSRVWGNGSSVIRFDRCTSADNSAYYGGTIYLNNGLTTCSVSNSILRDLSAAHNNGDLICFRSSGASTGAVAYCSVPGFASPSSVYYGYSGALLTNVVGNQTSDPLLATGLYSGNWSAAPAVDTNACQVILTDSTRSWAANGLAGMFARPANADKDPTANGTLGYLYALQFCIVSNTPTQIWAWYNPSYSNITSFLTNGAAYRINDYHVKSRQGRYTAAGWTTDAVQSPTIDAGDPAAAWSLEPKPNGDRLNMGAHGNTAQASKTFVPTGTVLLIL